MPDQESRHFGQFLALRLDIFGQKPGHIAQKAPFGWMGIQTGVGRAWLVAGTEFRQGHGHKKILSQQVVQ